MSIYRTIAKDSLANFIGLALNAIIQLIQVPVLSAIWGANNFGIWLMLSTIPAYIALTDLGFTTAATSDMTMSHARGDNFNTRTTYHTLVFFTSLIILVISVIFVIILKIINYFNYDNYYFLTIILLFIYSSASLYGRVVLAGFRSTGLYALGTLIYDITTFIEAISIMIFAYAFGGFNQCIFSTIIIRVVSIFFMNMILSKHCEDMKLGFRNYSLHRLKYMLKPAIAAVIPSLAIATNIQGMIILVGLLVSPAAAAILGPIRTISRLALQIAAAVNRGTMAGLATAVAKRDFIQMRLILRVNFFLVVFFHIPVCLAFCFWGDYVIKFWTNGTIIPPYGFVVLMGIAALIHGLWYFIYNLLLCISQHRALMISVPLCTGLTFLLAILLCLLFSLEGAGFAIIFGEIFYLFATLIAFRKSSLWNSFVENYSRIEKGEK